MIGQEIYNKGINFLKNEMYPRPINNVNVLFYTISPDLSLLQWLVLEWVPDGEACAVLGVLPLETSGVFPVWK